MKTDDLQKAVLAASDQQSQEAVRKVVLAGQTALFDEKAHKPIFDNMMSGSKDPAQSLGNGISQLLLAMYDKSGETIPQSAIAPAGAILIASAAEYGMDGIDDATIGEAIQSMAVTMAARFDEGFRGKIGKGRQQDQPAPPQQQGLISQQRRM